VGVGGDAVVAYEHVALGGVYLQSGAGPVWELLDPIGWDSRFDVDAEAWVLGRWSPEDDFLGRRWRVRPERTAGLRPLARCSAGRGVRHVPVPVGPDCALYLGLILDEDEPAAAGSSVESAIDDALRRIADLGPWPGDRRWSRELDLDLLRADVFDAISLTAPDPADALRAASIADKALLDGGYERAPGVPAQMSADGGQPGEGQRIGSGSWEWLPGDDWRVGPGPERWPGPRTRAERAWCARRAAIAADYARLAAGTKRRRIVPSHGDSPSP
jgi:hypothetical protein